jgi:hypothetical protein
MPGNFTQTLRERTGGTRFRKTQSERCGIVGRRIPSVFEGCPVGRFTFEQTIKVRSPNHFGQQALVLSQVFPDVHACSQLVHTNFVRELKTKHTQNSRDADSLTSPSLNSVRSLLSRFGRACEARIQAPHQLDGIINRISESIFSCGRRTAIQARQSPNQKHSGDEVDSWLRFRHHPHPRVAQVKNVHSSRT